MHLRVVQRVEGGRVEQVLEPRDGAVQLHRDELEVAVAPEIEKVENNEVDEVAGVGEAAHEHGGDHRDGEDQHVHDVLHHRVDRA